MEAVEEHVGLTVGQKVQFSDLMIERFNSVCFSEDVGPEDERMTVIEVKEPTDEERKQYDLEGTENFCKVKSENYLPNNEWFPSWWFVNQTEEN